MSAAGGSTNEDDYLLSCSICFSKYDLFLNRPKVLPCSHTFCFTCIQAVIEPESTLKCPMCRQTAVGIDKVESLPNNVHAEHNILLNKKLQQAEADSKISSKLLDAYFKSKKSECQVFAITNNDHEPKVTSFNTSKDAFNSFHETCMKIPDSEKPAKLRVISWQGFMCSDIPQFDLLIRSLIKILKSQSPDIVFLYNVVPATLDRLRKSLPDFKLIYEFHAHHMSVTLLNTSVSYDSHESVEIPSENSCCYDYLKVEVLMGSLKLKLINTEIDMYDEDKWREDLTKIMLNELSRGSDETVNIILRMEGCCNTQNWNMYQEVMGLPDRTVDVWKACNEPKMCNYIWRDDEMAETDVLKYHDFNGESSNNDTFRLSRLYLRPATSVFAQPKFYGEIELQNITPAEYKAILVDFDISSK